VPPDGLAPDKAEHSEHASMLPPVLYPLLHSAQLAPPYPALHDV
jgi:hypothetical protein